jgi:hypothetical protein
MSENVDKNNFFYIGGQNHPQYDIIKKHIERAVQDLFLESLRSQSLELVYIFTDEQQIDLFIKRILTYWESLENYEVCQEVMNLSNDLKERWRNRDVEETSTGLMRIRDLFKSRK